MLPGRPAWPGYIRDTSFRMQADFGDRSLRVVSCRRTIPVGCREVVVWRRFTTGHTREVRSSPNRIIALARSPPARRRTGEFADLPVVAGQAETVMPAGG